MPSIASAIKSASATARTAHAALGGLTGSAASQAAKSSLAVNVWIGDANNSLATADVYNPPGGAAVITDIENLFQKFDFTITDVLRGGTYIAQSLGQIAGAVHQLSSGDILSRVLGASNLTKSALNALGAVGLGNIANTINSGINMAEGEVSGAVGAIADQVYASVGGVVQQISAAAASGLGAVGAAINSLEPTAAFSITDNGAKISLFSGLIQTSASLGMSNSFGSLMATVTDRGMIGQVAMQSLPAIIQHSDVGSLASIGQMLGAGSAYAYNPNLLGSFSSNYTLPPATDSTGQVDYDGAFTDLTSAYSSVDPNWTTQDRQTTITAENGTTTTGTDSAYNLNALMNSSDDFQSVISQGAQTATNRADKVMALSSVVQQSTVGTQLQQQFPMTVFSGNSQSTNDTQDPLALAQGAPAPVVPTSYPNITPNTGSADQPSAGKIYDIEDPGVRQENGYYIWPDGHWQIGGQHTNSDGTGYVSKGITFN